MKKIFALAVVLTFAGVLSLPTVLQGGPASGVLNFRLRVTYPTLSAALADPGLMSGDRLLVTGTTTELAGAVIPPGLRLFIVSQNRPGLPGTITGGCDMTGSVINATARTLAIDIIGLNIIVPVGCFFGIGAFPPGPGPDPPLTVRNCRFSSVVPSHAGIFIDGTITGGPYTFTNNSFVNNTGPAGGIFMRGTDSTASINISNNTITSTAGSVAPSLGIGLNDLIAGPEGITVANNTINGAGAFEGSVGILLGENFGGGGDGVKNAVVSKNTVRNYVGTTTTPSFGMYLDNADGTQVRSNTVQNNQIGISVDACLGGYGGPCSDNSDNGEAGIPTPITIGGTAANANFITSTVLGAVGLDFNNNAAPFSDASYTAALNATCNWWGNTNGPSSDILDGSCTCVVGPGGLPVNTAASATHPPNCDNVVFAGGFVRTCPRKRSGFAFGPCN